MRAPANYTVLVSRHQFLVGEGIVGEGVVRSTHSTLVPHQCLQHLLIQPKQVENCNPFATRQRTVLGSLPVPL